MANPDNHSTPATDPEWKGKEAVRFENKAVSEYYDPCQEAAQRSIRCLHRNGGDREMCGDFFQYGDPNPSDSSHRPTTGPVSNSPPSSTRPQEKSADCDWETNRMFSFGIALQKLKDEGKF